MISAQGMAMDPRKIEVVINLLKLMTKSKIRRFLKLVGYYQRFAQGFS